MNTDMRCAVSVNARWCQAPGDNLALRGEHTSTLWFEAATGLQVKAQREISLETTVDPRVRFTETSDITLPD